MVSRYHILFFRNNPLYVAVRFFEGLRDYVIEDMVPIFRIYDEDSGDLIREVEVADIEDFDNTAYLLWYQLRREWLVTVSKAVVNTLPDNCVFEFHLFTDEDLDTTGNEPIFQLEGSLHLHTYGVLSPAVVLLNPQGRFEVHQDLLPGRLNRGYEGGLRLVSYDAENDVWEVEPEGDVTVSTDMINVTLEDIDGTPVVYEDVPVHNVLPLQFQKDHISAGLLTHLVDLLDPDA